jgi:hypothetical protein
MDPELENKMLYLMDPELKNPTSLKAFSFI